MQDEKVSSLEFCLGELQMSNGKVISLGLSAGKMSIMW